jgi:hypothetical protein
VITVTIDTRRTAAQLKLLEMPAKKRERLVWRAANELKKVAGRNISSQQDWNGQPWVPRKRGKRKMLQGLKKLIVIQQSGSNAAAITFKKGAYGLHGAVVASTHQQGHTFKITAASRAKVKPSGADKGEPASRAQARKLRRLGFKRPGKRKGQYRSASLGWITENINYAQAGLLIKKLRDEPAKQSWEIRLPARPFLGANAQQREQAFERALQGINYGWDVKKQEMRK